MSDVQKKAAVASAAIGAATLLGLAMLVPNPEAQQQSPPIRTAPLNVERVEADFTPDGLVRYLNAATGMVEAVMPGAPGQPVDPTPLPPLSCNGSHAGQTSGLWLCPSNVTQWTAQPWVWTGPPPLVPCSSALRGERRNGYDCTRDRATGRWSLWVPEQRR